MVDMNIKLCPSTNPITSTLTIECICKQQQTSQYIIMGGQNRINLFIGTATLRMELATAQVPSA